MPSQPPAAGQAEPRRHQAGLLDIRNIIGLLLTAYGVILTLMGLFGDTETEKTGGVNANLWAGIGLLVVGLAFMGWARLRPILVPEHTDKDEVAKAP
ncbi:hypothetical protein [Nocardioides dongkuii]|uniref:hypothetical protein n=1 Tax=Nocardioides dongkuii TaxID=2760089 RepID=UPI0015FA7ACC|nr:hypothetical protein [Nocardioides dongkuii]